MAEHADGIGVSVHHHVGETDIVVGCEVSRHDTGEHGLLVELNVIERLESQAKITQQAVNSQESDDGEVSQHAVQVLRAVLAGNGHGILVALYGSELLGDLRSLDQGVEDVEDAVAAPGVGVLAQDLNLLLIVGLSRNSASVRAERVELIDELINDIPSPVVLYFHYLKR